MGFFFFLPLLAQKKRRKKEIVCEVPISDRENGENVDDDEGSIMGEWGGEKEMSAAGSIHVHILMGEIVRIKYVFMYLSYPQAYLIHEFMHSGEN